MVQIVREAVNRLGETPRSWTIPTLREYIGRAGSFNLGDNSVLYRLERLPSYERLVWGTSNMDDLSGDFTIGSAHRTALSLKYYGMSTIMGQMSSYLGQYAANSAFSWMRTLLNNIGAQLTEHVELTVDRNSGTITPTALLNATSPPPIATDATINEGLQWLRDRDTRMMTFPTPIAAAPPRLRRFTTAVPVLQTGNTSWSYDVVPSTPSDEDDES